MYPPVEICACSSQIGSGALPLDTIPSAGFAMRTEGSGHALERLAAGLRGLAMPVIGRIEDNALKLDLRCLTDEQAFAATLAGLDGDALA